MQINGTPTGPTMAASEPPEPPPRNPERINASLHKLAESKTIKSLDACGTSVNEKVINNNKPLQTLLSVDNNLLNTTQLATAGASETSTTNNVHLSQFSKEATSPSPTNVKTSNTKSTAAVVPTTLATTPTSHGSNTLLHYANKRSSDCNNSPLSSNGSSSNHTLTNNSPMQINNQIQQQQSQRYSFHQQTSETQSSAMPTNGSLPLLNGANGSSSSAGALNANLSTVTANHAVNNNLKLSTTTTVDKKNANDVDVKPDCHNKLIKDNTMCTTTPTAPLANETSTLNGNNGDGNRNDEPKLDSILLETPEKMKEENERLMCEILRLRKLLENSTEGAVGGIELSDSNSAADALSSTSGSGSGSGTPQQRVDRLEAELRSARTQLLTLRIERKKLRSDKNELLTQVKQLCTSLQEKEQELRDFIRNFQERVRETETNNAKLTGDRDRERWQLLKQARDEAERSLALAQQLSTRDIQLQRLQEQLQEARRQLSGCLSDQESLLSFAPLTPPSATSGLLNQMAVGNVMGVGNTISSGLRTDDSGRGNSNSLSAFSSSLSGGSGATAGDRNSCSNESGLRNSSDRESTGGEINFSDGTCDNGPCITVDPDSISLVSNQNIYQYGTPKERSPTLSPLNSAAYSRSVEQLGSPVEGEATGAVARKFPKTGTLNTRNGRGGTWGSISRVFARSRNKNKALSADGMAEFPDYTWSPLSEEGYAEKLRLLREASQLPMERWRASQVLAWLEVALGMPQYSTRCGENVKSGKVLLELNDSELEAGLGLAHPMHRKKLRLAIEEQRRPELVRYPMIAQLGHTWVASEWLPDIGLPQYAESFVHSLVDARMLDTLSKKELEKFLGVTRKFHQASIVHGIHVLRIVKYDRQTLAMRRTQSESVDTDPIVWTNQRFMRWVRSIDLAEYADNLKDSGVHGGLVVLEPSFSGDTMATALGIPASKNIIRRHLTTEFEALILPARATLGQGIRSGCGIVPLTGPGGLQHYATADRRSNSSLRISAWKGSQTSLSKAFRFAGTGSSKQFRNSGDRSTFGNSTSPTPSYSSSEGGGGIYATVGPGQLPPPTGAPPPPPSAYQNYHYYQQQQHYHAPPPAGHRVSAPPNTTHGLETLISQQQQQLLYDQQRRVKSISDIGCMTSTTANSPAAPFMSANKPPSLHSSGGSAGANSMDPDSTESSPA